MAMNNKARLVALRECGSELFATQVAKIGNSPFIPLTERKRDPYDIDVELETVIMVKQFNHQKCLSKKYLKI